MGTSISGILGMSKRKLSKVIKSVSKTLFFSFIDLVRITASFSLSEKSLPSFLNLPISLEMLLSDDCKSSVSD